MSRFVDGALRGAIAGAVAGLADAAFALARGPFAVELALVSAGLFAVLGLLAGLVLGIVAAGLGPSWRSILRDVPDRGPVGRLEVAVAVGVVALALLVGLTLIGRARLGTRAPLPALVQGGVIALFGAAAVVSVRPIAARLGRAPRAPALALAAATFAALIATPWLSHAAETVDLRPVLVAVAFVAACVALGLANRPRRRSSKIACAVGLATLGIVAPLRLVDRVDLRLVAARYAPATAIVARMVGRVADFDADGYSPLSGLGDCAPWDPGVHPFAFDAPGNGRDEDCHGGDLDPALVAPRSLPELPPVTTANRPHILLVTVDTLRADRLGIYGYDRDTSPILDAFAEDAVVFERAYTSSPVTDRALPTMLGGLYPSMFTEAVDYREHELDLRRTLLAERLRDAGYYTATISTTYIVRRDRLQQGLQHVDLRSVHDVRAEPHTDRVLKFLARGFKNGSRARPLFLWVHYFDPHGPYEAPKEHRRWDDGGRSTEHNRSDRYDGEVHYVDAQIGRVFDRLRQIGVLDDMLVIVSADHGEEFLEHGGWYHAEELYDESVRVPLLVRLPGGQGGGRRIAQTVGLVDLMPTILELVDIAPPAGIEGRSQAAAVRGDGPVDEHPIFLEQWKHKTDRVQKIGVVDGVHKLVLDLENQLFELYDVEADPGETTNRYADDPATASRLRDLLLDYWAMVRAARQLDPEHGAF